MLVRRRRISLDRDVMDWVRQALAPTRVAAQPLGPETAVAAGLVEERDFPGDPADRFIYATAIAARARLVTADQAIRAFDEHGTIW